MDVVETLLDARTVAGPKLIPSGRPTVTACCLPDITHIGFVMHEDLVRCRRGLADRL